MANSQQANNSVGKMKVKIMAALAGLLVGLIVILRFMAKRISELAIQVDKAREENLSIQKEVSTYEKSKEIETHIDRVNDDDVIARLHDKYSRD